MMSLFLRSLACLLVLIFALPACKKKDPPKRKREDVVAEASRERRKISSFARALRKVIEWRQDQPLSNTEPARQALIKGVVEQLTAIPATELPADLDKAWQRMLKAWQSLAAATTIDAALAKEGREAAAELNRLLAANGYPDVRF